MDEKLFETAYARYEIAMEDTEIDGSKVTRAYLGGKVVTEDGREWYWKDMSYRDADTGWNYVADGEWVPYV